MRCAFPSPTRLDAPPAVLAEALEATFGRQRRYVKDAAHPLPTPRPDAGDARGIPSVGCCCAAGVDNAWTAPGFGSAAAGDGVSGRSPDGDALPRASLEARARDRDVVSIGAAHFPPADQRVATRFPKPSQPAHAQPRRPGRSGRDAQRRAQHDVGGCAQHTRPRKTLVDWLLLFRGRKT